MKDRAIDNPIPFTIGVRCVTLRADPLIEGGKEIVADAERLLEFFTDETARLTPEAEKEK